MKLPLLLTTLLLGTSLARADLYLPTGVNTGVTSQFTVTVDSLLNQVQLMVDNRYPGPGGVTGTITSFGFTAPASVASSGTLISQSWVILNVGHAEPTDWTFVAPYEINAGGNNFGQTVGLITGANPNGGNPHQGIQFGEVASFVIQFDNFATADGFFGPDGLTARWQEVTVNPGSDVGFSNGFTPIPEPSTYGLIGASVLMLGIILRRRRAGRVQAV